MKKWLLNPVVDCEHCKGKGYILMGKSLILKVGTDTHIDCQCIRPYQGRSGRYI